MEKSEIIKSRVKIEDILNHYGLEPIRGKYLCPFHSEKTPSASVKNNRLKCFGACGKSWSVIDFVIEYENVNFNEACKLISNWFGLEIDRKLTKAEKKAYAVKKRERELKRLFDDMYERRLHNLYLAYAKNYAMMLKFYKEHIPNKITEEFRRSNIAREFIKLNKLINETEKILDKLMN